MRKLIYVLALMLSTGLSAQISWNNPNLNVDGVSYVAVGTLLDDLNTDGNAYLFADLRTLGPTIPENLGISHRYISRTGRQATDPNTIFRSIRLKSSINGAIIDSVTYSPYNPGVVKLPLPTTQGRYYYEEVERGVSDNPNEPYTRSPVGRYTDRVAISSEFVTIIRPTQFLYGEIPTIEHYAPYDALILVEKDSAYRVDLVGGHIDNSNLASTTHQFIYVKSGSTYPVQWNYRDADGVHTGTRVKEVMVSSAGVNVVNINGTTFLPRPRPRADTSWSTDQYYSAAYNSPVNPLTGVAYLNPSVIVDLFKADALRIARRNLNAETVVFRSMEQSDRVMYNIPNSAAAWALGTCRGENIIFIDYSVFNRFNFGQKMALIYHELGHNLLDLQHGPGMMEYNVVLKQGTYWSFTRDRDNMFLRRGTVPFNCN